MVFTSKMIEALMEFAEVLAVDDPSLLAQILAGHAAAYDWGSLKLKSRAELEGT